MFSLFMNVFIISFKIWLEIKLIANTGLFYTQCKITIDIELVLYQKLHLSKHFTFLQFILPFLVKI
jgi:hypothetical protein